MKIYQLLEILKALPEQNKPLTASFSDVLESRNIYPFSPHDEYWEFFINEYNEEFTPENDKGETIAFVIEIIEKAIQHDSDNAGLDIILTYGNEEDDIISTMGGAEWKDNEFYVNTKTCPRQV